MKKFTNRAIKSFIASAIMTSLFFAIATIFISESLSDYFGMLFDVSNYLIYVSFLIGGWAINFIFGDEIYE